MATIETANTMVSAVLSLLKAIMADILSNFCWGESERQVFLVCFVVNCGVSKKLCIFKRASTHVMHDSESC